MGSIIKAILILAILSVPPSYAGALTIEEAVQNALVNNHSFKAARLREGVSLSRVGLARGDFMPAVWLGYSYSAGDSSPADESAFSASLSVNLFNGYSDLNSLKAARAEYEAARFSTDAARADLVYEVRKAFINVLKAMKGLEVSSEAVELLERQKKDAALYYREGLTAKNELLKVEVELASALQRHIEAEGRVSVATLALERSMGTKIESPDKLKDLGPLEPTARQEPNVMVLRALMLEQRSELAYQRALKRAGELKMRSLKGNYLPDLDMSLSYSLYGDTAMPDGREGLDDAESKAMLTATWYLFDGYRTRHQINGLNKENLALDEDLADTVSALGLQLDEAVQRHEASAARLRVALKAVEQARENYRITENQFRQRVATSSDLLDARVFLTRALSDRNGALYDLHLARALIERVVENPVNNIN